jgi:hypothetical protein
MEIMYVRTRATAASLAQVSKTARPQELSQMRFKVTITALSACLLFAGAYSVARAQDRDNGGYQQQDHSGYNDQDRRGNENRHFTDRDRQVLGRWYANHADEFEPRGGDRWNNSDVERDLQPDRVLDEDMRRWARPLPDEIAGRLDPLPRDWRYMMIGYNVAIVDRDWTIRDVYHLDQFSDQDRRAIQDWNRNHPDAMKQILGGFGVRVDNGDLDRRLEVGNVVDPDLQNRARPAPDELANHLSVPPRGWRYVIIGDRLCLVDRDWRIHESFNFQH